MWQRLLIAGVIATGMVTSVSAQVPTKERARLVVLDTCVMASATKSNTFTDFTKICQCAATKSLEEMSEGTISSIAKSGELGFGNASIWRKHMKACGHDE